MADYQCKFLYKNSSLVHQLLVLEPWADEYSIAPDVSVEVLGTGGVWGSVFELEQLDDRLIIYAWPGSTASVVFL